MNKARELDPLSLFMNARVGMALYYAHRFEAARDMLETTLEVDPGFAQAHYFLSLVCVQEGRYKEAIGHLPDESFRAWVAVIHAMNGDVEKGRAMMDEVLARGSGGYAWPSVRASFCFATGDIDGAFEWMNRAVEERDPRFPNMLRSPLTDSIKDDPRFAEILGRSVLSHRPEERSQPQ